MNLKIYYSHHSDKPKQFLNPEYLFNKNENFFFKDEGESSFAYFKELERINFFIGANNSGKSRFIRGIFNTSNLNLEVYEKLPASDLLIELRYKSIVAHLSSIPENDNLLNNFKIIYDEIVGSLNFNKNENLLYDTLVNFNSRRSFYFGLKRKILLNINEADSIELKDLIKKFNQRLETVISELKLWKTHICNNKVYIPPLRSLMKSPELEVQSLHSLAINHLNLINTPDNEIYVGLTLYDKITELKFSRESESVKKFEKFIGNNFFNGSDVEIIPDERDTKLLLLRIDNEEHRSLNEIGDGIQSIILLLYPIFTSKNNTWFFIEEPETHLHPGFQRVFLETLINNNYLKEKNLKYFFTTHSNHFLDLSIYDDEISIFQFNKIKEKQHLITSNIKPNNEVLEVLGVNTSSVFLANTSLWVEGPTDRKYLSKFLKLYCESRNKPFLKEDIDFAFFEYGGNLIAHYLFDENDFEEDEDYVREKIKSFALANKIYLLADHDNAKSSSKKGKRRVVLQALSADSNNFFYQNTELKEIENLLPLKTIKGFMNEIVDNEVKPKLDNIHFKKSDYDSIGIGDFYQEKLEIEGFSKDKIKAFKAESGTLKNEYKIKLCKFFIDSDIKYSELIKNNPKLDEIIEKLYCFISPTKK